MMVIIWILYLTFHTLFSYTFTCKQHLKNSKSTQIWQSPSQVGSNSAVSYLCEGLMIKHLPLPTSQFPIPLNPFHLPFPNSTNPLQLLISQLHHPFPFSNPIKCLLISQFPTPSYRFYFILFYKDFFIISEGKKQGPSPVGSTWMHN